MNTSGTGLKQPEQINWEDYNPGSKYVAPPAALDASGKPITYYGVAPDTVGTEPTLEETDEGYRQFVIDPIKVVKSGAADGYEIRFARVNTKQFTNRKTGKPVNANSVGNYLRAAGVLAKPQTNDQYEAAVRATKGKVFGFTIDWSAYNKDTGEKVNGYLNFPEDPDRPGQRKSILKKGDQYTERDYQGNVTGTFTVTSEVLFANARVRFFQDPTRKGGQ